MLLDYGRRPRPTARGAASFGYGRQPLETTSHARHHTANDAERSTMTALRYVIAAILLMGVFLISQLCWRHLWRSNLTASRYKPH
jgi:hypothetical protein